MGEGQSKDAEQKPHEGPAVDPSLTPSQQGFSQCFKSEKKNEESFGLFLLQQGEQELKFMDVRPHHSKPAQEESGLLNYEMFWTGELEGLDQEAFKNSVDSTLSSFEATRIGALRECGCMISMVAYPFQISEENAQKLGKCMFGDFGNVAEPKKKEEEPKKEEEEPKKEEEEPRVVTNEIK